ncbi:MAG: rhodanese-like domain-containing protein [Anaerolineales bacterium]
MYPEITVTELGEKLKSEEKFILLDVRELPELDQAEVIDSRLEVTPMSRLAQEGIAALSGTAQKQEIPVYVMCHHGNRSLQVTMWLAQQGFNNTFNVRGGIDEYARKVDSSVGSY